jgi:hypothetical protein
MAREVPLWVWNAVHKRDNGLCVCCGAVATDQHHIVPRSRFGDKELALCHRPENIVELCRECHTRAHSTVSRARLLRYLQLRFGYAYDEPKFQQALQALPEEVVLTGPRHSQMTLPYSVQEGTDDLPEYSVIPGCLQHRVRRKIPNLNRS